MAGACAGTAFCADTTGARAIDSAARSVDEESLAKHREQSEDEVVAMFVTPRRLQKRHCKSGMRRPQRSRSVPGYRRLIRELLREIVTGFDKDRQAASTQNRNRHDHFGRRRLYGRQRNAARTSGSSGIFSASFQRKRAFAPPRRCIWQRTAFGGAAAARRFHRRCRRQSWRLYRRFAGDWMLPARLAN